MQELIALWQNLPAQMTPYFFEIRGGLGSFLKTGDRDL